MSNDPASHVALIARGIMERHGCAYRPSTVKAITVQAVGPTSVVVWIVTETRDLISAVPIPVSYRFHMRRMDQYAQPIVSTDSLAIVSAGGIRQGVSYWEMPGNVRDLGITAGHRALGVPLFLKS